MTKPPKVRIYPPFSTHRTLTRLHAEAHQGGLPDYLNLCAFCAAPATESHDLTNGMTDIEKADSLSDYSVPACAACYRSLSKAIINHTLFPPTIAFRCQIIDYGIRVSQGDEIATSKKRDLGPQPGKTELWRRLAVLGQGGLLAASKIAPVERWVALVPLKLPRSNQPLTKHLLAQLGVTEHSLLGSPPQPVTYTLASTDAPPCASMSWPREDAERRWPGHTFQGGEYFCEVPRELWSQP